MTVYNILSEQEALYRIFNYFQLNLLTNPECSFINGDVFLGDCFTCGSQEKRMPKTFEEFKYSLKKVKWEVCLCVAGTDCLDNRRVVMTYSKALKRCNVHFPMAQSGLTANENKIRLWVDNAFSPISK